MSLRSAAKLRLRPLGERARLDMNKPDVLIYVGANPDRRRSVAEEQQKKLRVQDNPAVTEVYVNKFLGAVYDGGAVALTFGSIALPPPT